jgi:DNA-binding GntR family transcriptional regulator
MRPHRGAVVKLHTADEVRQIYDARIVLETYALRKAAAGMTPARLKRLERLAARLDRVEPGDGFFNAGVAFYRELYQPVNEVIADLSERLRGDVGRYWLRPRLALGDGQAHSRLVEHLRAGDADAAAAWLEAHLREVAGQVAAKLEAVSSKAS